MKVEYKNVAVSGVQKVEDEGKGIVTAYVSVTGIEDNVKDVILPGAYKKTLVSRKPKGAWGHDWKTPTARTLEAKELKPGDPELPKTLSDGSPWPEDAGALRIKMQFNLGSTRGRDAYSDVLFFKDEQEWSIGYKVPDGGSYKKDGVRYIKELDLYEYSPVLFGAMSHARTASVKEAQFGLKLMEGIDLTELKGLEDRLLEFKSEILADVDEGTDPDVDADDFVGDEEDAEDLDDAEYDEYEDDEDEEDEDDEEVEDLPKGLTPAFIRSTISNLETVLTAMGEKVDDDEGYSIEDIKTAGATAFMEAKAAGYDYVEEAVENIDAPMDRSGFKALQEAAADFDAAWDSGDQEAAEKAATDILDALEDALGEGGDGEDSLRTVARVIADKMGKFTSEDEDEEDEEVEGEDEDYEADDDEEDEDESKMGTYVVAGKKKKRRKNTGMKWTDSQGNEFKNVPYAGRLFGMPEGDVQLGGTDRMRAFVGGLKNESLLALDGYLDDVSGENVLKTIVADEISDREYAGVISEKIRMPKSRSGGQSGRGGGSQRMRAEGRGAGNSRSRRMPRRELEADYDRAGTMRSGGKRAKEGSTATAMRGNSPDQMRRAGTPTKKAIASKKPTVRGGTRGAMAGRQPSPLRKGDGGTETKREFSPEKMAELGAKGKAFKNGNGDWSYPIENEGDLKNAIKAYGRCMPGDKKSLKAYIKKHAKQLGMEHLIPEQWNEKTEQIDTTEMKSLMDFVNSVGE